MPTDLRAPLSIHIYEEVYDRVDFLMNKDPQFIQWICPLLQLRVAASNEYVFYEGEQLDHVYFLKNGQCDYVLPEYSNAPYVRIVEYSCFGFFDIVAALQ